MPPDDRQPVDTEQWSDPLDQDLIDEQAAAWAAEAGSAHAALAHLPREVRALIDRAGTVSAAIYGLIRHDEGWTKRRKGGGRPRKALSYAVACEVLQEMKSTIPEFYFKDPPDKEFVRYLSEKHPHLRRHPDTFSKDKREWEADGHFWPPREEF